MKKNIRILVVDDHIVVRKGLIAVLETEPGFEIVGEAGNGAEAIQLTCQLLPDVVLMDVIMPVMDGIEATRQIKRTCPVVNILILTSVSSNDKVFPCLNAGAIGYLLKDSTPDDLIRAIRRVAEGEGSLDPGVTRLVLEQMHSPAAPFSAEGDLTERELEVLKLMARGLSNAEIARDMVVSNATVHTHVSRILTKLNLSSRTQAALYAIKRGLVPLD
ncbi:MAG: DNA-binding response regulator [Chloroflexi bacterium HGW-Chloroflexi-6]|nr:MAG: DNA-binding response regulator [Chloroflexi bacterium HGW-Chloroflexi-6]